MILCPVCAGTPPTNPLSSRISHCPCGRFIVVYTAEFEAGTVGFSVHPMVGGRNLPERVSMDLRPISIGSHERPCGVLRYGASGSPVTAPVDPEVWDSLIGAVFLAATVDVVISS